MRLVVSSSSASGRLHRCSVCGSRPCRPSITSRRRTLSSDTSAGGLFYDAKHYEPRKLRDAKYARYDVNTTRWHKFQGRAYAKKTSAHAVPVPKSSGCVSTVTYPGPSATSPTLWHTACTGKSSGRSRCTLCGLLTLTLTLSQNPDPYPGTGAPD